MSSPVEEMTKAFQALAISDGPPPPEQWLFESGLSRRWEDDPKDPDGVRSRFLEDWPKFTSFTSRRASEPSSSRPTHRVSRDSSRAFGLAPNLKTFRQ
jgi:hypothetical protein